MAKKFILRGVIHYETKLGERIMICGSDPKLGNWDALTSFGAEYMKGSFWYFEVAIITDDLSIEYKYVLCKENENGFPIQVLRWEESQNRKLIFKDLTFGQESH